MTKRKLLNILLVLAIVLLGLTLFVNSKYYSNWAINLKPATDSDSYWQGISVRYDGLFIPTIEDIEIISNDEVIYKPQIDKNHRTNSYTKEVFEEYLADGMFDFIEPKGYKLYNRGASICIGINREIVDSVHGPKYIRIKYSDALGHFVKDVVLI